MEKAWPKPVTMGTENWVRKRYGDQLTLGWRDTADQAKRKAFT